MGNFHLALGIVGRGSQPPPEFRKPGGTTGNTLDGWEKYWTNILTFQTFVTVHKLFFAMLNLHAVRGTAGTFLNSGLLH